MTVLDTFTYVYANNGLKSYVNKLHSILYPKQIDAPLIIQWFRVLPLLIARILRDAGVELFLLLIFWVVLMKMSQGRDLVVSFFEPDGLYGIERVGLTVLATVSYAVSMWIIPAFLFEMREKKGNGKPFKRHLFFIHRLLPLIPFWLLASSFFNSSDHTFIVASLGQLIFIILLNHLVLKTSKKRHIANIITAVVIVTILSSIFCFKYRVWYSGTKILLTIILYLCSYLLFYIFHYADAILLKSRQSETSVNKSAIGRHRLNTITYLTLAGTHVLVFIILIFWPNNFQIAPESALLYIFSLYIFMIDFVFYLINISLRRQSAALAVAIILVCVSLTSDWALDTKHHHLERNADITNLENRDRDVFEDRYIALREKILNNSSDTTSYPIILVSGEGGGSRAGMWFSQVLINLDLVTNAKFRQHIFSVSTVSGSSVGMACVLGFWENTEKANTIDNKWQLLPSMVFSNNYVGSSIRGILLTDVLSAVWPYWAIDDRNKILQREEAREIEKAIFFAKYGEGSNASQVADVPNLLERDFMNFFYTKSGNEVVYKPNMPITMINTCRSDDGRRGIFSSIKLDNSFFNDALDINAYLYEDSVCELQNKKSCSNNSPISLGQACNASELFPVFSAPMYIDSLGSFVDGGYHENSGLKTTLDIYYQLKYRITRDKELVRLNKKYKIYIVYIKNGTSDKQLYKPFKSKSSILQPLTALINQPFNGSQSYFEDRASFIGMIDPDAKFIQIGLDNKLKMPEYNNEIEKQILADISDYSECKKMDKKPTDLTLKFPLARWLSKTIIKSIKEKAEIERLSQPIKQLIQDVNNSGSKKMNSLRKVSLTT